MFKKLKTNKWTAILVALVLVTSLFVGGTIARYVTSTSSEDEARVAVWGINTGGEEMDLFDSEYLLDGSTNEYKAKSADDEKIIAPGLSGMSEFKIIEAQKAGLAPEVMYEVIISLDDSEIADEIKNHPGIEWKVDNGEWGTWEEFKTSLLSLSGDPSGMKVYAPGVMATEFANGKEHTVAWQWIMDSGYNVEDTAMGNYAAEVGDITAKLSIEITARQTDIDSTGMLEGNGQVYDISNPTTLTFRSAAPLNELQSVKIGDDTLVKDNDYTTASGSTIVTLKEDYLADLEVGNYTISIISTNMTARANFSVTKTEDIPTNNTLVHNGIIPKDAVYYTDTTSQPFEAIAHDAHTNGTELVAGQPFPSTIKDGDVYVYNDYVYIYNYYWSDDGFWFYNDQDGWGVRYTNFESEAAPEMLTSINNKNIVNLHQAFAYNQLKTAPTIPNTATILTVAFYSCSNLTGVVEINATDPSSYAGIFSEVNNPIVLKGTCPKLSEIASEYDNVTVAQ